MKNNPVLLISVSIILSFSALPAEKADFSEHTKTFGKPEFNKHGIAFIVTPKGWVAVNRKKEILYYPFIYDNGPDPEKEGMIRFKENGKIGFANAKGRKVIPAKFDYAGQYEKGKAEYCIGCKEIKMGEHSMMDRKTGEWGIINTKGKKISE
ncbi:MAG TPA: WG repeat-containing protein [Leptospiraceae bacterium]|nr:WG repeat-containing protein [Leptospiraceae bacterium]HNI97332.1 WG repeat-containing protein [Leptospiraceae bacterium]HNN03985.1 WG repeat-containing protein [Leptospiraceae bacterium]